MYILAVLFMWGAPLLFGMDRSRLRQLYEFPGFSDEDLGRIMDAHEYKHIAKGDYLLRAGETADEYLIVDTGVIRSYVISYDGDEVTTDFYAAGDVAIEVLSLFQRVPSQEYMMATSDCSFWSISFEVFQMLFMTMPVLPEWGRAWMSGNLFYQKQRSTSMITMSATERYLQLLRDKPTVLQQAPLKYISSYLGVTDTSLSRIRKEVAAQS